MLNLDGKGKVICIGGKAGNGGNGSRHPLGGGGRRRSRRWYRW